MIQSLAASIYRLITQFFLYTKELVVFGDTI
jgi:hypothetical protein